jgi:hypothetical protein
VSHVVKYESVNLRLCKIGNLFAEAHAFWNLKRFDVLKIYCISPDRVSKR